MTPAGTEPPLRAPLTARCRRLLRSLAALSKTRYWLLTRALWVALAFVVVFVVNGMLIGWSTAYEVLIGIKSPAGAGSAPVTWLVSIVGWLMIPAFVGGTVRGRFRRSRTLLREHARQVRVAVVAVQVQDVAGGCGVT
ncbi:DUF6313 family protein [Nonomuraea sp. NPDC049725]|uniref:DUF6313 family protein n=1 Tax=Nonomuraea sp. NPDC049725 TaxID=3154508 RepID=UPI0034154125